MKKTCWLKSDMSVKVTKEHAVSWHRFFEDSQFEVGVEYFRGQYVFYLYKFSYPGACQDYCRTVPGCVGFSWYSEFEGCKYL